MMKRLFLLLLSLCAMVPVSGKERAAQLVEALSAHFRAMNAYEVRFEVASPEGRLLGSYHVEGRGFYLTLGDAELYSDGKLRYEVNNTYREVVVDKMDASSRSVLDNPVSAFDFLDTQYAASLLQERDGVATLLMTPSAGGENSLSGVVTVQLSVSDLTPRKLVYDNEGERVDITILEVTQPRQALKKFNARNYPDYEIVDFK